MPLIRTKNEQGKYEEKYISPETYKEYVQKQIAEIGADKIETQKKEIENLNVIRIWTRTYTNYNKEQVTGTVSSKSEINDNNVALVLNTVKYGAYSSVNTKEWATEPIRGMDYSLSTINNIRQAMIPRLSIVFSILPIEDYENLAMILSKFNEMYVEYYDKAMGKKVIRLMYATPEEMTAFYNLEKTVYGIMDFKLELNATLNEKNYGDEIE